MQYEYCSSDGPAISLTPTLSGTRVHQGGVGQMWAKHLVQRCKHLARMEPMTSHMSPKGLYQHTIVHLLSFKFILENCCGTIELKFLKMLRTYHIISDQELIQRSSLMNKVLGQVLAFIMSEELTKKKGLHAVENMPAT